MCIQHVTRTLDFACHFSKGRLLGDSAHVTKKWAHILQGDKIELADKEKETLKGTSHMFLVLGIFDIRMMVKIQVRINTEETLQQPFHCFLEVLRKFDSFCWHDACVAQDHV